MREVSNPAGLRTTLCCITITPRFSGKIAENERLHGELFDLRERSAFAETKHESSLTQAVETRNARIEHLQKELADLQNGRTALLGEMAEMEVLVIQRGSLIQAAKEQLTRDRNRQRANARDLRKKLREATKPVLGCGAGWGAAGAVAGGGEEGGEQQEQLPPFTWGGGGQESRMLRIADLWRLARVEVLPKLLKAFGDARCAAEERHAAIVRAVRQEVESQQLLASSQKAQGRLKRLERELREAATRLFDITERATIAVLCGIDRRKSSVESSAGSTGPRQQDRSHLYWDEDPLLSADQHCSSSAIAPGESSPTGNLLDRRGGRPLLQHQQPLLLEEWRITTTSPERSAPTASKYFSIGTPSPEAKSIFNFARGRATPGSPRLLKPTRTRPSIPPAISLSSRDADGALLLDAGSESEASRTGLGGVVEGPPVAGVAVAPRLTMWTNTL